MESLVDESDRIGYNINLGRGMPSLYVVATPIGNLEDVTLRALRIMREVKLIAAEDTRQTRKLLDTYGIKTPMTSYHEHNKRAKLGYILDCLKEGDVALISDAGTPGISDPGYELVQAARRDNIPVVSIPGPSVVTTALVVSGLPADRFLCLGFLPQKAGSRQRLIKSVADEPGTIVAFEAPHRLQASLQDILLVLGDRQIAVCRELTKLHEEVYTGTVREATEHFQEPRGEFTLVIAGKRHKPVPELTEDIQQELERLRLSGIPAREAVARIAEETGLSKRELYRAWIKS